ncbi:MAG: DUF445 family protein [Clostridia bacterium]|nr:DUF445 family protein [Clostridia bacterium]
MSLALWSIPLIGALIGWFTNYLAVKMIFRPQKPVIVPVLGIVIQGVLPKRKPEIARSLGEIVARELVSFDEVAEQVSKKFHREDLVNILAGQANEAVMKSLPSVTPEPVKAMAGHLVAGIVRHQAPDLLTEFTGKALEEIKKQVDLAKLVEDKINQMDWEQLERLVLEVSSKELKHIEVLGGVIGFMIGVVQLVLAYS